MSSEHKKEPAMVRLEEREIQGKVKSRLGRPSEGFRFCLSKMESYGRGLSQVLGCDMIYESKRLWLLCG